MPPGPINPRWRVSLLGPFRLEVGGQVVSTDGWKSKKALTLFKFLLADQGGSVSRELILERLWPNEPIDKALRRLHSTVYFLRKELQVHVDSADVTVVWHVSGQYRFNPHDGAWYDTEELEALFKKALAIERSNRALALQLFLRAIDLYRGDFLPEEAWAEVRRRHFFTLYIESIVKAATLLADENDTESAIGLFRLGLEADPLREDLHQAYIRCLIAEGHHGEAGRHFAGYRAILQKQFNLQPGFSLDALMQEAWPQSPLDLGDVLGMVPAAPFICDRKTFDAILNLEVRRQKRTGERLAMFELVLPPSLSSYAHQELQVILNKMLRREDVLCWAEESLVLIQLPRISRDMALRVRKRFEVALKKASIPYVSISFSVIGGGSNGESDLTAMG